MKYLVMIVMALVLVACGQQEDHTDRAHTAPEQLYPIEVNLNYEEPLELNEWITFEVVIMQNNEPVEDAQEVKVELWKEGEKENSEILETTNAGDGIYRVTYLFEEEGRYVIQPHVTARDMHSMPQYELTVGDVQQTEDKDIIILSSIFKTTFSANTLNKQWNKRKMPKL
ncbi:FixH family protein [Halalkalibacterium ligniniphilum]|uniref:FixH family protein n=1 Tax=Halalkalibacterium ligniniphilum TaxID=1134413 RepID=UPI00034BF056|nr:FixH family protein [Halalkalibacterium ligniniphilum]